MAKTRSKELLQEFMSNTYDEIREAKAQGEPIGFSTSNFPKEIVQTLDLKVMYPENHSAAIAAKKGALAFCESAEAMGYSIDLCSYARINLGFVDRKEDFGHGLDVPNPDFLCVCNNICTTVVKWYENLAYNLDIPFVMYDVPYNTDAYFRPDKINYIKDQTQGVIEQLEKISGRTFDYDKFQRVLEISNENGRLFRRALDLIGMNKPSPASGFDGYNFMSLMVTAKGRPETTEILKTYISELEEHLDEGTTTFKGEEKHRLLFDGLACWPFLRHNSEFLSSQDTNIVGSVYCNIFATEFDDLYGLCEAYSSTNDSQGIAMAVDRRQNMMRDYHCDGTLCNVSRSCKPWVGIMYEVNRQLSESENTPYTMFDADQADPRLFSEAQYETRVQGLVEIMDERETSNEKEACHD